MHESVDPLRSPCFMLGLDTELAIESRSRRNEGVARWHRWQMFAVCSFLRKLDSVPVEVPISSSGGETCFHLRVFALLEDSLQYQKSANGTLTGRCAGDSSSPRASAPEGPMAVDFWQISNEQMAALLANLDIISIHK